MPNNVRNRLIITGDKLTLSRIMGEMVSMVEDRDGKQKPYWFDFDKLIPMPEQLRDIQSGRTVIDGVSYANWRVIDGQPVGLTNADIKALVDAYGATDWYKWAVNNWGTKWNAYGIKQPVLTTRSLKYDFQTAWSDPRPVIQALVGRYNVTVRVEVSGEVDKPYSYTVTPGSKSATSEAPEGHGSEE